MLNTNSKTAVKHAATLSAHQLAAIPATNSTDARLIARAELANLWTPDDCWTEGVMLELADYIEHQAFMVTGADKYALFDLPSLAAAMDSKSAAVMVVRLAGGYRDNIKGVEVMSNRDGEKFGKVVTFPPDFVRTFWTYMTDDMEYVLGINKD